MNEIITNEPVLFQRMNDKEQQLRGTLLSMPIKILELQIWTKEGYQKVPDAANFQWKILNHQIILNNPPTHMPYLHPSELILPLNAPNSYPTTQDGKMGLLHSETGFWHQKQILITYETSENTLNEIIKTVNKNGPNKSQAFPSLNAKIASGDSIDIFVFGDSISEGGNASDLMKFPPFQPAYPLLFVNHLKTYFQKNTIQLINGAKGGMASKWGMKEIGNKIKEFQHFKFDLTILAWGANDAGGKVPAWKYIHHIKSQIRSIRKINPQAEFLLISSSLPNALWRPSNHPYLYDYQKKLKKLVQNNAQKCVMVDITEIWRQILEIKSFYDITGNGLNHPNDYGHQIYAKTIFEVILNKILKN